MKYYIKITTMPVIKHTTASFIERAKAVHGNKYDYSEVEYVNNCSRVIIICPIHGKFEQTAVHHINNKRGCQKCGGSFKLNTDTFIKRAYSVHGNKYDYSKVEYKNARTNVIIICPEHGEFSQTPDNHINKQQICGICSKKSKYTTEDFIKQAQVVHGNKYDYSLVDYKKCNEKVIIICPIHGQFEQSQNQHIIAKHGCQKCGGRLKSNTNEFIDKANIVHGGKYDYSNAEYELDKKKINIICPRHGQFSQKVNSHLAGKGCIKCSKHGGYSKKQIQWLEFLEIKYKIKIWHIGNSQKEYTIKPTKWKADGYDEEHNTIYEFHGDFWHGNPKKYNPDFIHPVAKIPMQTIYEKTMYREQKIKELGYNLVVIWESEWKAGIRSVVKLQRKFRSYNHNK